MNSKEELTECLKCVGSTAHQILLHAHDHLVSECIDWFCLWLKLLNPHLCVSVNSSLSIWAYANTSKVLNQRKQMLFMQSPDFHIMDH